MKCCFGSFDRWMIHATINVQDASVTLNTYKRDLINQYYPNSNIKLKKDTKCGIRYPNFNIDFMKGHKESIFSGYVLGLEFLGLGDDHNQVELLWWHGSSTIN